MVGRPDRAEPVPDLGLREQPRPAHGQRIFLGNFIKSFQKREIVVHVMMHIHVGRQPLEGPDEFLKLGPEFLKDLRNRREFSFKIIRLFAKSPVFLQKIFDEGFDGSPSVIFR